MKRREEGYRQRERPYSGEGGECEKDRLGYQKEKREKSVFLELLHEIGERYE